MSHTYVNGIYTELYFFFSFFHVQITVSVTKGSHQDHDPCYLHLPIFSFTYTLPVCAKIIVIAVFL